MRKVESQSGVDLTQSVGVNICRVENTSGVLNLLRLEFVSVCGVLELVTFRKRNEEFVLSAETLQLEISLINAVVLLDSKLPHNLVQIGTHDDVFKIILNLILEIINIHSVSSEFVNSVQIDADDQNALGGRGSEELDSGIKLVRGEVVD